MTLTARADRMCQKADAARRSHRASSGLSLVARRLRAKALIAELRRAGHTVPRHVERKVMGESCR